MFLIINLSPNCLGQLFFQKLLDACVTNLRINKVSEPPLRTGLSIGEIGRRVAIEDPHDFSRLYKNRRASAPINIKGCGTNETVRLQPGLQ